MEQAINTTLVTLSELQPGQVIYGQEIAEGVISYFLLIMVTSVTEDTITGIFVHSNKTVNFYPNKDARYALKV